MKISQRYFLLMVISFLFIFSDQVPAAVIVDTGQPPTPENGGSAWYYAFDESLATRFVLSQDYVITDLEGWIWEGISAGTPWGNFGAASSTARVTLYGDALTIPDVGQQIFTGAFSVPNNDPDSRPLDVSPSPYNWYGLSGLNVPLTAGAYWIAFESRPSEGDNYYGAFGYPAPNPLAVDAYKINGPYVSANFLDLSLRIQGEPFSSQNGTAIPEPASIFLLLFGLCPAIFQRFLQR